MLLEHYQGKEGRAALLNALRSQFLVDGNSDIANTLASTSEEDAEMRHLFNVLAR